MSQLKEEDKIIARELNKMEMMNTPDREFKVMVIKRHNGLEQRVDDLDKALNEEIENIKKNQSEMKNSINEIKIQ